MGEPSASSRQNPVSFLVAFGTGILLTFMVHLNGAMASYTTPFFSSLAAHGTGTVAAIIVLLLLRGSGKSAGSRGARVPLWAYLGGVSGAATVVLTSATVNSPLALSGTLALGLAGQTIFGLAADRWGLFGLPRRALRLKDAVSFALILSGSLLIILFSGAGE